VITQEDGKIVTNACIITIVKSELNINDLELVSSNSAYLANHMVLMLVDFSAVSGP